MGTVFGVDYASYQQGESLAENYTEGFHFAYLKATQGTSYTDPDYAAWAAHPGGMLVIPYHYATTDTPAAQAAHFKSVAGPAPAMMLDCEQGAPTTGPATLALIHAFTAAGYVVDLYLPHWWWIDIGSPDMTAWPVRNLVASQYPTTAAGYAYALYPGDDYAGWNPYGGRTPTVLQFTDAAIVGGKHVDADAVKSMSVFDLGVTTPPTPPPTPAPGTPTGWAAPVKTIQTQLNRWPFSPTLTVNGTDGTATKNAIRTFQKAGGLTVDGLPGPATYRELTAWYDTTRPQLAEGSTGSAVTWLQKELNRAIDAGLATDGTFGPTTKTAVEKFQQDRGLTQDGVAGRDTNAAVQI
jgi:peptidoglycan hydrolase-like protein with peptidoglycan-binding domain